MQILIKMGLMALIAGSLLACATTKQKASSPTSSPKGAISDTGVREGHGEGGGGRSVGRRRQWSDGSRESSAGKGVTVGEYRLSLDMHRDDGCGVSFVGVHSRGRLTLEVRRSGRSGLTLELKAQERSGPRVRSQVSPRGRSRYSRRSWKRKYEWAGGAIFSGKSVTLKLTPVGKGCQHKAVSGVKSGGCYSAVPKLEAKCRFACLADSSVQIRRREPGADVPRCGHLICRFEKAVEQKRKRVDQDLKFFSNPLLLTRDGRPEMLLRRLFDGNIIEGELLKPKPKPKNPARP